MGKEQAGMLGEQEIYGHLAIIFADVFRRDVELRPDLSAKDVEGWDSLKQIEIIMATEEQFAIRLTTSEIDSLRSVADLVRVIAGKD